jgi:general secretion pathway protein L
VDAGRARVRFVDGAGFATTADRLAMFWERAGRPMLLTSGDALPAGLAPVEPLPMAPSSERMKHAALDLRQGEFASARPLLGRYLRRAAIVTACGLAAHAAIAAADSFALVRIADERRAETETLVALARPGAYLGDDLVDVAATLLPEGGAKPATFLPLLSRVSDALKPVGDAISFDGLRFAQASGALTLAVNARDSATLGRASAALRAAGLGVRAGMAMRTAAGVRADMIVEDGQ